jgi:hypothetical protein
MPAFQQEPAVHRIPTSIGRIVTTGFQFTSASVGIDAFQVEIEILDQFGVRLAARSANLLNYLTANQITAQGNLLDTIRTKAIAELLGAV